MVCEVTRVEWDPSLLRLEPLDDEGRSMGRFGFVPVWIVERGILCICRFDKRVIVALKPNVTVSISRRIG
jgi:hypothetical protein